MFDWFWSFLYEISKTLFKLIDGLIQCANYFCGIEPVKVEGEEIDFLQYILMSDQIAFAFRVTALIGMIIVVVFSVIAILRTLAKEKAEGTPTQIVGKAIKSILSFLFIPLIMIVVVQAGNIFMEAMYRATMQGYNSLGDFLFSAFALESGVSQEALNEFFASETLTWRDTDDVWYLMGDLSKFEFIFSWVSCGVILGCLGMSMMYFVSRIISIALLYIVAPFSIGASILDDGARFKLWREQMLIKFITGYGMMIAINIFAMICLLVMNPELEFVGGTGFINYLMKLLLIAGGGISLKQTMALIGNLVSSGAGSNELRDAAIAGGISGVAGKVAGKIPGAGLMGAIGGTMKQEITGRAAQAILPSWAQRSYGNGSRGASAKSSDEKDSDSKNSNSPKSTGNGNAAKKAISGGDNKPKETKEDKKKEGENTNNKKPNEGSTGNNMVNDAIQNSKQESGGYDDLYES